MISDWSCSFFAPSHRQFSIEAPIEDPNVVESPSAIPFRAAKQNDVVPDLLAHITLTRLPRPIDEYLPILIRPVPTRVVDLLIFR
jgi:hypothetical protein